MRKLALIALLSVSACTTQQDILKRYDMACQERGFKPKTEAHFNCTVQMEQLRVQRWKGFSDGMRKMQQSQPQPIYNQNYIQPPL